MLTIGRLKEVLCYNHETGTFTWNVSRGRAPAGAVAGTPNCDGYCQIKIDRVAYLAHRLAWLYTKGVWPPDEIDHVKGDRADNSIDKLRLATRAQNNRNIKVRKNNIAGIKGVSIHADGGYRARIRTSYGELNLGYFKKPEHAAAAYRIVAAAIHGEFARVA